MCCALLPPPPAPPPPYLVRGHTSRDEEGKTTWERQEKEKTAVVWRGGRAKARPETDQLRRWRGTPTRL